MQLRLERAPPPPEPPRWLRAFFEWLGDLFAPVGRFFRWISGFIPDAPVARILLWTVLAGLAAAAVWMVWRRVKDGAWRWPGRRRPAPGQVEPEADWAPEERASRAWLQEADALAAQGRYAEAVHHLLFRSVEDIARRRPRLVQPALTSRELAAADGVPATARSLFAGIAGVVERSLFGGRAVGPDEWTDARRAYADFALPGAWRG